MITSSLSLLSPPSSSSFVVFCVITALPVFNCHFLHIFGGFALLCVQYSTVSTRRIERTFTFTGSGFVYRKREKNRNLGNCSLAHCALLPGNFGILKSHIYPFRAFFTMPTFFGRMILSIWPIWKVLLSVEYRT